MGEKVTRIIIIACTKIEMEDYGSAITKKNILWVNPTTGETVIHQLPPETADSAVTAAILKLYLKLTKPFMDCHRKRNNGL